MTFITYVIVIAFSVAVCVIGADQRHQQQLRRRHPEIADLSPKKSSQFRRHSNRRQADQARTMMEAIRKGLPILITEPEPSYYVGRSRTVKLSCQAVNAIQINFICNDKHVGPNEIKTIEVEDEKTGLRVMESYIIRDRKKVEESLELEKSSSSSSTKGQNTGPYWCQCLVWSLNANPKTGQPDSIYSRRSVIHMAYLRRKFEHEPESQRVAVGGIATFTCTPPAASPEPIVRWFHGKRRLDNDGRRIVVDPKLRQISIFDVRPNDDGNYTCVAENIGAKRVSSPARLTVVQNGRWSSWSSWSRCVPSSEKLVIDSAKSDVECIVEGSQRRHRNCNRPKPKNGGKPCSGQEVETKSCKISCEDATAQPEQEKLGNSQGWSEWSEWSDCSQAPECRRTRRRTCLRSAQLGCSGLSSQSISCAPSECARVESTSTQSTHVPSPSNSFLQPSQWHPAETALMVTIPLCSILLVILLALIGVWIKRKWVRHRQLNVVLASTDFVSGSRGLNFFTGTGTHSLESGGSSSNKPFCYSGVPGPASSTSGVSSSDGTKMTTEVFMDGSSNFPKSRLTPQIGPFQGTTIVYTSPPLSNNSSACKVPASEPLLRRSPPRGQPAVPNQVKSKKNYNDHSIAAIPLLNSGASSSGDCESPPSASTSPGTTSLSHHHSNDKRNQGFVTPPPYTPPVLLPDLSQSNQRAVANIRLTWNHVTPQADSELNLPAPINAKLFVPAGFCYNQFGDAFLTTPESDNQAPQLESGQTLLSPLIEWGTIVDGQNVIEGPKPVVLSFPHCAVAESVHNWDFELLHFHSKAWHVVPNVDNGNGQRYHLSSDRIFIFTRMTGRFVLVGRPRMQSDQSDLPVAKRLSFAAFVPRHLIVAGDKTSEVNMLLYTLNDNGADLAEAVRVEEELGMCLVTPQVVYAESQSEGLPSIDFVHPNVPSDSSSLSIEVSDVSAPWFLRGHAKQAIPHSHVWSATSKSLMHCSFTFSRNSPASAHRPQQQTHSPLSCNVVIRQMDSTLVLKIDCPDASSSFTARKE